jgi:calcium-dependent protein kinase
MGVVCCTNTFCTRTYSQSNKNDIGVPPLKREKEREGKIKSVKKKPTATTRLRPKYEFPKFCKILSSLTVESIEGIYKFEDRLGEGKFGVVNQSFLVQDRSKKFAIKSIRIESIMSDLTLVESELDILKSVDHPNIIKHYETYNDGTYLHIVTELCAGGELYKRIKKEERFSEREAATIMEKILTAISFLHSLDICHRDIKPENLTFSTTESDAEVKVIDFGLSTRLNRGNMMKDIVGTPFYVAPEVLQGVYNKKCDIWSLGVVLYTMLNGTQPFTGSSSEVLSKVAKASIVFHEKNWANISSDARDFISKTMERDPKKRLTAKQCLDHCWIKNQSCYVTPQLDVELLNQIRNTKEMPRLKKEALGVIKHFTNPLSLKYYIDNFRALDISCDGYISAQDLVQAAKGVNVDITEEEAERIVNLMDFDKNGHCSISDFIAATLDKSYFSEEIAKLTFDHYDVQRDEFITVGDLMKAFKREVKSYTNEEVESIIKEVDLDHDGKINYTQFKEMLLN